MLAQGGAVLAPAMDDDNGALLALIDVLVPEFADWAAIDLVDRDVIRRIGTRHASADAPAWEQLAERFPKWIAPVRRAMATGTSLLSFDVVGDADSSPDEDRDHIAIAAELALVSCMVVPVRVRGLSLAAITMATGAGRRGYRPSDLRTAEQLAARAAAAIERGMLYRDARASAERADRNAAGMARLVEAALAFAAARAPADVLDAVAEQARRIFGAARAAVAMQINDVEMRSAAPAGEEGLADLPLEEVIATNRPTRPRGENWMGVPLVGPEGTNRGAIFIADQRDQRWFGPDDEALAVLLGQLASLAVESARRYDAVHRSEQRVTAVLDTSPMAIVELSPEGNVTGANAAAGVIFGWPPASDREFHPETEARLEPLWRRAVNGTPAAGSIEAQRADGTPIPLWVTTVGLRDATGKTIGALLSAADLTERRALEQQLQQSQRMEAMGRLAGGLAHDFGNLLTVILGYCEFLLRIATPGHPLHDDVVAIQQAGERATTLTEQLLTISSRRVVEPVAVDVRAVVLELEGILRRLIGEDIEMSTETPAAPACIRADRGQLEQIVLNLVINARHAMPNGGVLKLRVDEVDVVDVDASYTAVRLTVSDNGVGMDQETLDHCFEPFFSTRERSKGTGLGLATVYGIVHQAGGQISVESQLGRGTTFRVVMPKVANTAPAAAEPMERAALAGSETILLVEDEPEVRELARDVLERRGYHVLTAEGVAALDVIRDPSVPIDLLVTDVVMPDLSGFALAEQAVAEFPQLAVLFISGYTDTDEREWPDAGHFLAKPFRPDQLTAKVRFVLDSAGAAPPAF
ncbi:MAG: hypothetical protein JWO37_198 [Acidimicrobiales bacterium]|jgi:PAS domain S-box-containing protein|nr:hypothetical protein [Acidimicrobiales bacterium]